MMVEKSRDSIEFHYARYGEGASNSWRIEGRLDTSQVSQTRVIAVRFV